jgi:eukaryotic-like serine/threonine-protein kinase
MREVVKILPNRALYRENLALYSSYAGKFDEAEREATLLKQPGVFGLLALAFAQIGQGRLAAATETYRTMGRIDAQGASYMASGLADLAIYEGRYSDAANILEAAAKTDVTEKDTDRAAAKYVALAYARLMRGENRAAIVAAEQALDNSRIDKIQYMAGRIFIEADGAGKTKPLISALSAPSQPAGSQAYAKLLEGTAALKAGDSRQAIKSLEEANTLFDSWMGRFELGRAYLATGAFTQADSEFDKCIQRRGEVLSLFLDEEPTYGYLPPVYYYQGKAREGLKTSAFADSYRTYIDIRGQSLEDKLLPEARKYSKK